LPDLSPSISKLTEGDSIMTRTETLARLGRCHLFIEPVRSESDGSWRIEIAAEGGRALLLDTPAAALLADALRHDGESLLATRIEMGIERAWRHALSESGVTRLESTGGRRRGAEQSKKLSPMRDGAGA
jgi:hypothetical protein